MWRPAPRWYMGHSICNILDLEAQGLIRKSTDFNRKFEILKYKSSLLIKYKVIWCPPFFSLETQQNRQTGHQKWEVDRISIPHCHIGARKWMRGNFARRGNSIIPPARKTERFISV